MNDEKLIPKLRFSGFTDEWIIKKLNDVSDVNPKTRELPEKFIYIDLDSVNHGILTKFNQINKNDAPSRAQRCLDVNDILFQTVRPYQMNNLFFELYDGEYVASTGYAQIKSKIVPRFLYYYLHYNKFVNEVLNRCTGTSYPAINSNDLKKIKIKIPSSSNEQKLIGDLFYKLDQKIELLKDKYHYYQDFKKFLMHQIFAQKLRFNFTDEWEKYLLGDISSIGKGFTPSTGNPSFWDGDLKWLSIADMNQGKYINQTTKKITSDGSKNKEPVKKGTLLMSFKLSIGKLGILTEDMYTNEAICNFKWKNKDVLTEYMYYYLSSINILKYGSQAAKGITLNNETLSTIPVLLPSIEEQKKIINILSDVDLKINMLENSINDTSKFKKGLLQQMFI